MAHATIANLWSPAVWIRGVDEKTRYIPSIITSGAVLQSPQLDEIATGAGTTANIPFFKDITDTAEGIQVEATAPTVNAITGGTSIGTILNREVSFGVNALAAAVTGEDVVGGIVRQLALARQKRMQTALMNTLRGLFGFSTAPAAGTAVLNAAMAEHFSETGASPAAGLLIDSTKFNNAAALLGELQASLLGGAIWMHPTIRAALLNSDENSFERTSRGDFILETYKGIPVYVSAALSRAGTTSGTVFDTYILSPNAIGYGAKPQVDGMGAASLQYDVDPAKNQEAIYDRTRYLVHVDGTRFTGSPAGQSATNAELATVGNWGLAYQSADRCGIVCMRTNG